MNAHALLTTQGWLGPGHALDSRLTDYGAPTYKQKGHRGLAYDPNASKNDTATITTGNGLVKPLLVSQRYGSRYGIGKKAHEPQSGNQWWLKGFQSALDNVGKSESERSSGTSTPQNGAVNGYSGKHSGLYGYFVQGQLMKGTIHESAVEMTPKHPERKSKKRKSDVLEEDGTSSTVSISEQNQDPLAVPPTKRTQTTRDLESSIPYFAERDKHRKKHGHGRAQSTDLEAFTTIGQFFDVAESEQKQRRRNKSQQQEHSNSNGFDEILNVNESGEQEVIQLQASSLPKQQGRKKKESRTLARMVEEELAKLNSVSNSTSAAEDETEAERMQRKAERRSRRRRKKKEEEQSALRPG